MSYRADLDNESTWLKAKGFAIESELQSWFLRGMLPSHPSDVNCKYFVSKKQQQQKKQKRKRENATK